MVKEFVRLAPRLEVIEVIGLFRFLGVALVNGEGEAMPAEQMFEKAIEKFCALPRKRRREILRMMRAAAKKEVNLNGTLARDCEAPSICG